MPPPQHSMVDWEPQAGMLLEVTAAVARAAALSVVFDAAVLERLPSWACTCGDFVWPSLHLSCQNKMSLENKLL